MVRRVTISPNAVYFEQCVCLRETAKAILVAGVVEGEDVWIPKSQVHADSEVYELDGEGTLAVTAWWAEQRGWE